MKAPIIVVTGPIGSGKTTVARIVAARGGTLIDCDELARDVLEIESVRERLVARFGESILTRTGRISPGRLGSTVFADGDRLGSLNRIVRPAAKRIIRSAVSDLRPRARYIVLDAVLFFQYKFSFKADLVVATLAPESLRLRRLVHGRGFTRADAMARIERQRPHYGEWKAAETVILTDVPRRRVEREAGRIRDAFCKIHGID